MKIKTRDLVLTAVFAAIGILLPQAFHQSPYVGQMFSPMHIPVLLCGFICGRQCGALCGLVTPLLASWFFGMPPLFPTAVSMSLELATYGWLSGFLVRHFHPVLSLVIAMIAGRAVMGVVNWILLSAVGKGYTFAAFLSAAFIVSWPAIVIQIIAVPLLLFALHKAKLANIPTFNFKAKTAEENV